MPDLQLPIPDDNRILFFKRDRELFGFLSNYHDAPVTIDGEVWRSTEFYYQAQKSHDPEYREAIRNAKNSDHAKGIGSDPSRSKKARKRSWFHGRLQALRTDWHDVKWTVMETAVRAKFFQNHDLQALLLATGDAEIVEDSTHDPVWGIGRDGRGENRMGRLLMKVRQELRDAKPPLSLEGLLASWQKRTPYPQFLWFGIWRPDRYEWAQRLIAEGPATWRDRGRELADLASDWSDEKVDPTAAALLEACARGELLGGMPWVQEYLKQALVQERPLGQYMRDCGNFFSCVAGGDLVRAAVRMAEDERYEKNSRRHERLAYVLCHCIPGAEDRLRLFEAAVTRKEYTDIRMEATELLPELFAADERYSALLRVLVHDPDEVVRFWAAYHLTRIDPSAPGLLAALSRGFHARMTSGYDCTEADDTRLTIEALERVSVPGLREAARQLALEELWENAAACCTALRRHPAVETIALVTDLRQRLLAETPSHWFECLRLRGVASDLLTRAAERLELLCWDHGSELEDRSSMGGFIHRLHRMEDRIAGFSLGWDDDGCALVGQVRGSQLTLLHLLSEHPKALATLEGVEELLREAEAVVTQVHQLDETEKMDPIRMKALSVIEETLTSVSGDTSAKPDRV